MFVSGCWNNRLCPRSRLRSGHFRPPRQLSGHRAGSLSGPAARGADTLRRVITGDLDRAIAHFEAAIQADLAQAHWPAVIASRLRYAEALSLRDKPGDSVAAQREQATAAEETAALGIALPGLL